MDVVTIVTIIILVLTAILVLGLAAVQYVFVVAWGHWTVAGILSSMKEWLVQAPDLINRVNRFYGGRKRTPDGWEGLVKSLNRDCTR